MIPELHTSNVIAIHQSYEAAVVVLSAVLSVLLSVIFVYTYRFWRNK